MQLVVGSFEFEVGGTAVDKRVKTAWGSTGRPSTQTFTFTISGTFLCSGQADAKAKELALEAALRVQNQPIYLRMDDGNTSAVIMRPTRSITGVRIVSGPDFPTTFGAEMVNYRTFQFVAEMTNPYGVLPDGTGTPSMADAFAVDFRETLEVSGGGPKRVCRPNKLGLPRAQLVWKRTPYVAVQAGTATGLRNWPVVPPPIWPFALEDGNPVVTRSGPRQEGLAFTDYVVSWRYTYVNPTPLVGMPTVWRNA